MSFRGRILIIINTLVSSVLWHKLICLQPPDILLKEIQQILENFFRNGHHLLRSDLLCRPLSDGGQGLIDVKCRLMAFWLKSIQ